jgi:predicted nuclease of predicted toxin-antitoxin system
VTFALLLDEMLSPKIAGELRRRGHDVVAVAADPTLRSKTDAELFEWAIEQGRRIVTENVKDFRPLLRDDASGPGVLFLSSRSFPRSRNTVGVLIRALEDWLVSADSPTRPPEDWLPSHRAK